MVRSQAYCFLFSFLLSPHLQCSHHFLFPVQLFHTCTRLSCCPHTRLTYFSLLSLLSPISFLFLSSICSSRCDSLAIYTHLGHWDSVTPRCAALLRFAYLPRRTCPRSPASLLFSSCVSASFQHYSSLVIFVFYSNVPYPSHENGCALSAFDCSVRLPLNDFKA
jgi:hypothetical protein